MVKIGIGSHFIDDIELFVFDKDGTLIDLYNYWSNMIDLRAQRLCSFYNLPLDVHKNNLMYEMGVDLETERLKPEGPVGLLPREVVQKAAEDYLLKLDCKNVSGVCFKVFKNVDELSLSLLDRFIKPLDGAIDLLKKIKERNAKVAIATTDKTHRVNLATDFLNISNLVDLAIGSDKVESSKPAPDMLKLIGDELDIDPANSVMIGDARTDIQMGINAGFKASIGICGGLTSENALAELTPYVIKDISQIYIV